MEWPRAGEPHPVSAAVLNAPYYAFDTDGREIVAEVRDACLLEYLVDVRQVSADWLAKYNLRRPHDSLGRVPPRTFMPRHTAVEV